jgi:ADP-ribose diphosphatase
MMHADPDPRPAHAAASDDALHEHRVSGERVFCGKLLDVRRDRVRLPDGSEAVREYIVHPGAVLIVPVQDDGRLIVERQFRYPHNRVFLEFPAGKLDPGEGALVTAARELREETGYDAVHWTRLGVVHPGISYSTEAIELYAARGLAHVGAKLDAGEFLETLHCTEAELYAALDADELTDAKTVTALVLHTRWQAAPRRSVRMRIEGVVQGVGYRDWMLRQASAAGVAGWVRNRRDGSVEARLQGAREACDRVADACMRGPRAARVTRVLIEPCAADPAMTAFDFKGSA